MTNQCTNGCFLKATKTCSYCNQHFCMQCWGWDNRGVECHSCSTQGTISVSSLIDPIEKEEETAMTTVHNMFIRDEKVTVTLPDGSKRQGTIGEQIGIGYFVHIGYERVWVDFLNITKAEEIKPLKTDIAREKRPPVNIEKKGVVTYQNSETGYKETVIKSNKGKRKQIVVCTQATFSEGMYDYKKDKIVLYRIEYYTPARYLGKIHCWDYHTEVRYTYDHAETFYKSL